MLEKFTKNNLLLLLVLFVSMGTASANDTIRVRPNFYHIDHQKNIIVINKSTAEINSTSSGLKNYLMLDEQYDFVTPVSSVNTTASYQVECRDSIYTAFFTQLPIIHIDTRNQIVDTPSVYAAFSMSETNGTVTQSAIGIEIRGAFSQTFPKKSYELSLWNDTLGTTSRDLRLLNMRNDNKWNLQAMYNEPLRMQNKVSHELWQNIHQIYYKNLEPDAKNGIDMTYVEVFVNDEYKGIYALSERIDRKQLKLKKYDNQTIKGELYKGSDWGGAVTFTSLPGFSNTSNTWGGFEYKHPEEQIDWTNLYNFVSFVENSSTQYFNSNYKNLFKLNNAVDYYIFLNLLRAGDNTGKNIYIAKYKAGEPYYYVPWDLDGVFGNDWQGLAVNVTDDLLSNGFYDRLNQDCSPAGFRPALVQRWAELRTGIITHSNIMSKFAANTQYLVNNNAYEREHIAWNDFAYDTTQLAYVNNWLSRRITYLDGEFSQTCNALSTTKATPAVSKVTLYPNPAAGYVMVENEFPTSELTIQDVSGRIVLTANLRSKTSRVDISRLPKGLYVATVRSAQQIKKEKLVIE